MPDREEFGEELDIIRKARNGDRQCENALFLKYEWLARSVARKYFLAAGEDEDLEQEARMGIFEAIKKFNPDKSNNFRAFAGLCMESKIKDAIRISARKKHKILTEAVRIDDARDGELPLPSEYIGDPVSNYIEREGSEKFYEKLRNLFKPARIEVLKYYMAGYTYAEIAELTGMSAKKVDNAICGIKKRIKEKRDIFESY